MRGAVKDQEWEGGREGGKHAVLGRKEQKVASGKARLLSPVDQRAEPSC